MKKLYNKIKKVPIQVFGVIFLFLLVLSLFIFNTVNNNQAMSSIAAQVRFEGEYRIKDGEWHKIDQSKHISSTQGDVTLRGNFQLYSPDGEHIGVFQGDTLLALYTDHINVTVVKEDYNYVLDHENPLFAPFACGIEWNAHHFQYDETKPIEMIIHNPHQFGNENAIDELLSNVAIWGNIEFEEEILESGNIQRNIGLSFIIIAFALLGTSLFCYLLHVPKTLLICLLGFPVLFAGIYFAYSAPGVSFWSESIINNTTALVVSMMLYMLFILAAMSYSLKKTQKIGIITTSLLGIADAICIVLPMLYRISIYDTLLFWIIIQTIANIIFLGCLIKELFSSTGNTRLTYIGMILLLIAYEVDVVATKLGIWKGGYISKKVFVVLLIITLFVVLMIIPRSINAAAKAKELEIERSQLETEKNKIEIKLKESRISLMLSQIRPHFIYNTLGTIERMCLKDPHKAFELVRNFSLYLRGNFSELDSVMPICFSDEMKHVEYYVNIEKVRFPDINIEYDLKTLDFDLPALSVQPLVENAIKHGLMGLETCGSVYIRSYETSTHFCVEVADDGVGYDVNKILEDKKHVGLRNIRERLKSMVNGELIIESQLNAGTKALIRIPKELTINK